MYRVSFSSAARSESVPRWAQPDHWGRIVWETRVVALAWAALVVLALLGVRGAGWLLLALVLSHVYQAIWLTAEHTGLPHEGTILARTRTTQTAPFISWWLWNMNYHAEHHAWPAIPWHALPSVHRRVADHVEHQARGYWRLQAAVLRQTNLPDGVAPSLGS
jgi:fatty acid desaturase